MSIFKIETYSASEIKEGDGITFNTTNVYETKPPDYFQKNYPKF